MIFIFVKFNGFDRDQNCSLCFDALIKVSGMPSLISCRYPATETTIMEVLARKAVVFVCGTAAAIMIASVMFLTVSRPANAKPEFAAQTGLPCGRCHVNPAGGGKNTAFGEKFKANGFKVPKK
jgi:hypothetical protein